VGDAEGNASSYFPSTSDDGLLVAFVSNASNLIPDDTNERDDIFVVDRSSGEVVRASVSSAGEEAETTDRNGQAWLPQISGDGGSVLFSSYASNLVADDTNGVTDLFVHDLNSGETERVSVSSSGAQSNSEPFDAAINASGRFVAFSTLATTLSKDDAPNQWDVFLHDRKTGRTRWISRGFRGGKADDSSWRVSISSSGRYIAFDSDASNLVENDGNGTIDIFRYDRRTGKTILVSKGKNGEPADKGSFDPSISADGDLVVFQTGARNLVKQPDGNHARDVYLRDIDRKRNRRISLGIGGYEPDGSSFAPRISADDRFVTYESDASNLVASDTNNVRDVFVFDRVGRSTTVVSVNDAGESGDDRSLNGGISADGCVVVFGSAAANLVEDDMNDSRDVFARLGLMKSCYGSPHPAACVSSSSASAARSAAPPKGIAGPRRSSTRPARTTSALCGSSRP
jgi:hypothetical protein